MLESNVKIKEEQLQERFLKIIENYRPIDDGFSRVLFRHNLPLSQKVLRIITGIDDLTITYEKTQEDLKRLYGSRGICLDVYAEDSSGRKYDLEFQRKDDGSAPERARYHSSAIDVESLNAGDDFTELPITYVIFITENDVIGANRLIYKFDRIDSDTGIAFNDGSHILYINGAYDNPGDDSDLAKLVHDFRCKNADDMYMDFLAEQTRYLKQTPKGVSNVSDELRALIDEITAEDKAKAREEGIAEGRAEGIAKGRAEGIAEGRAEARVENTNNFARSLLLLGKLSTEDIAKVTGLTMEKILQLAAQENIANA